MLISSEKTHLINKIKLEIYKFILIVKTINGVILIKYENSYLYNIW